jgi:gas vesicle protein
MRPVAEHPETTHAGWGLLLMLGGVVMGAAVGLLTAPQSGERTRRHIVRTAEDAKEQVTEVYNDVTEKVEDLRRGVTGKVAVAKQYLDKTTRGLLAGPPRISNPLSRLIHTLRG